MFGFGKKKKIRELESELEGILENLEEAEVTLSAKDDIIQMMLEEKKDQEEEIKKLEKEIAIYEVKVSQEERWYSDYLKTVQEREHRDHHKHNKKHRKDLSPSGKRSGLNSQKNKNSHPELDSNRSFLGASKETHGKIRLQCSACNLPSEKRLTLKLRQFEETLQGGKSEASRPKKEGKGRSLVRWKPVSVSITELDDKKAIDLEVWIKGSLKSAPIAVTKVSLSDLLNLSVTKQKADYELYPIKFRPTTVSNPHLVDQGGNEYQGTTLMRLLIQSVSVECKSRRGSSKQQDSEGKSLHGVRVVDLVGKWTARNGSCYYVTAKGYCLDKDKHCFGKITIATDKEDYDLGLVNEDEGGTFYFARLKKGCLNWSDGDTWSGRDSSLVVNMDSISKMWGSNKSSKKTSGRSLKQPKRKGGKAEDGNVLTLDDFS